MNLKDFELQSISVQMLILGAFAAFCAVGLGAFGAHGLKPVLLENDSVATWETAVQYQVMHALALIALAIWPSLLGVASALWRAIYICWGLGFLFFSGSLYGLALGGPRWLGPVTPLGGLLFMAGWLILSVIGFKLLKEKHSAHKS